MTRTPFEPHDEHDRPSPPSLQDRDASEQAPDLTMEDEEPDEVPERAAVEGEPVEPAD